METGKYCLKRKGNLDFFETFLGPGRDCRICISSRRGGVSFDNGDLNLSIGTGDEDANVHENRALTGEFLGSPGERVAGLSQVHGKEILSVTRENLKSFQGRKKRADGLLTRLKNQWLSISIGDCQPVAVYDSREKALCMVHAGWGGTALKIVEEAVKLLKSKGSKSENLYAMLGPCIGQGSYEVDQRVFDEFAKGWPYWQEFVADRSIQNGHIDISGANRHLLLESGIIENQITEIDLCTFSLPSLFFSHRRDGLPGGRMFAFGVIQRQV